MRIFALADLHLSHADPKPMDIYGERWADHTLRIKTNWCKTVEEEDYILIPGDISWAMRRDKAHYDLDMLEQLPGQKICIRGNHDYWWDKPAQLSAKYHKLYFLQNKAYMIGSLAICGTRGWLCPNSTDFNKEDEKILNRELIRMRLSLEDALKKNAQEIILMQHFPPAYKEDTLTPFRELFKNYPITHVVYGHLHDELSWKGVLQGLYEGITYHLVSADYLNFTPQLIRG